MMTDTDQTLEPLLLEIDCAHQVHRIVDFIVNAESRVIVLHGRPNSGKTELIRQWVIPALRGLKDVGEVWYGDCTPKFPAIVEGAPGEGGQPLSAEFDTLTHRQSIIFIDTFGNIFDGPREERRAVLDALFGKVCQPDVQAKVVLVTESKHLTSIYGLGVYDPRIVDAVLDIGTIALADALLQLAAAYSYGSPHYSDEVLNELTRDAELLEHGGVGVTFDLLTILDNVFRSSPHLAQDVTQYKSAGRLSGILRTHLEETLKHIAEGDENAEATARGILERVAEAHAQGVPFAAEDLLARLAVSQDGFNAMLNRLLQHKVLREVGPDSYLPIPLQLTTILEQDLADQKQAQERITHVLDEAVRSWSIVGNLLPPTRFAEIHRERRKLVLSSEHTRFMLHNALRYGDGELEDAGYYWLRRLPNRGEGADVLLASLFSDNADVRMRAARLLRRYPEPEVRTRLHAVALTDPDERVREQAVASLEPMKTDGLMNELLFVVKEEKSNYRIPAIATLKLFKDPRVTDALADVVRKETSPQPVRKNAIAVLGSMNTKESVDALLEIALSDAEQDRQEASAALGRTTSSKLLEHILGALEGPSRIRRARVVSGVVTLVMMVAAATIQPGFWSGVSSFGFIGEVPLLALAIGALVLTGKLLRGIRTGEIKRDSPKGVLAIALFFAAAVSVGFIFHGLPQALIKQWRRAIRLFALEVLAIAFIVMFISAVNLPGWMGILGYVYFIGGTFLFFGCYAISVYALLFGTIIYRDRLVLRHRKNDVYRRLLSNPDGARYVFNNLDSANTTDRHRARRLLNRFGTSVPDTVLTELLQESSPASQRVATRVLIKAKTDETVNRLEQMWRHANAAAKQRIASVLCRRPTSSSVEALRVLRPTASYVQKARFILADWQYRLAVWPRATRVFLVVVAPLVGMVVYHGFKVVTNPAWGQIITLGSKFDSFDMLGTQGDVKSNMVTAAIVAAEHYPDKAADHMLRMFRDRTHHGNPAVHAALAQGLVMIDSTFAERNDPRHMQIRHELVQQAGFFGGLIGDARPDVSEAAIDALQAMANSRDSLVSRAGARVLQRFVFDPGNVAPEDATRIRATQANVISALGSLRAGRAFTALRSILDTTGTVYGPEVRLQQTRVAERAYANLIERQTNLRSANLPEQQRVTEMEGMVRWSKRLLAYYEAMEQKPTRLIDDLKHWIDEVGDCDKNADFVCDPLDDALAAIVANEHEESGYRQALDYFAGSGSYEKAALQFEALKQKHPRSVWPHKLLAEIYHEYLDGSASNFERSYQEMVQLRQLEAFGNLTDVDRRRFLADFAEIALTARVYRELADLATEVLQGSTDTGHQLNMALFLYTAEVMQRNEQRAATRLSQLEAVVQSLPKDGFYNNWVYPGTRKFIENSNLPQDVKDAVLALCVEGYWYSPAEAAAVIARNRKALPSLN